MAEDTKIIKNNPASILYKISLSKVLLDASVLVLGLKKSSILTHRIKKPEKRDDFKGLWMA